MEISTLIRLYRKQYKLTQEKLGEIIGVSQDVISLWELKKSKPDFESVEKMCILFDLNGDEILGLETEEERKKVKIFKDKI